MECVLILPTVHAVLAEAGGFIFANAIPEREYACVLPFTAVLANALLFGM